MQRVRGARQGNGRCNKRSSGSQRKQDQIQEDGSFFTPPACVAGSLCVDAVGWRRLPPRPHSGYAEFSSAISLGAQKA